MTFFDVSWPITNDIATYPGNVEVSLRDYITVREHGSRVSYLHLGSHTGTHYDAPNHFIQGAPGVETIPLDATIGPARVLELTFVKGHVQRSDLEPHDPRPGERLLLKTRNSEFPETGFREDFLALTEGAAAFLVERQVRLVGIDYLSIEPFKPNEPRVHRTLLGSGVVILEGLRLRGVPAGRYGLHAPPLLFVGGDGAPARAVLAAD